jgi:hypothetical protein
MSILPCDRRSQHLVPELVSSPSVASIPPFRDVTVSKIEVDGVATYFTARSKWVIRDAQLRWMSGRKRKLLDDRTV